MVRKLERTTFETSRAAEYFNLRELQAQTGQPIGNFVTVALKELTDNALDACETSSVQPDICIEVTLENGQIIMSVQDNAHGIAPETIKKILNFETRTSDKSAYRSPTRGAQGNALKTILGMPHAFGINKPIIIEAGGMRHTIMAWIDPADELRIDHAEKTGIATKGTRISLVLPIIEDQTFRPDHIARGMALFNPHALINLTNIGEQNSEEIKQW